MLAKSIVFLTGAAALGGQAVALNAFRAPEQKRDVFYAHTEVVYTTQWVTVTVTGDYATAPTTFTSPTAAPSFTPAVDPMEGANFQQTPDDTKDIDPNALSPEDTPTYAPAPAPAPETDVEVQPQPTDVPSPSAESQPVTTPTPSPQPIPEPAPAPAPAPVPAPAPGSGKRGIAYNDANLVGAFFNEDAKCEKCSFSYNWDSRCDDDTRSMISFVPQLWSPADIHSSRWAKNAEEMISKGSTHLLGFNECDNKGQCNMSPAAAAAAHVQWMNPYGDSAQIGSPSVTNSNIPGEGLDWLQSFMTECKQVGCKIDFCAAHWYSPIDNPESLFSHLEQVHNICDGKPVWLTEFAPLSDDEDAISDFLETVMARLDSTEYVHAYSYFMATEGKLLSSPTALSKFGRTYATA